MAIKINIRKILSTTTWSLVGAGVAVLLVAAIRYRNSNTCKGYLINISGPSTDLFITKKDISSLLTPAGALKAQDRPIQSFDLHHLEVTLEKNIWVRKARLYFDNNSVLHVDIVERTPTTRIFTEDGNSFYLDSEGVQLPLITPVPVRLPVFTGYPSQKTAHHETDSLLTTDIRQISAFIRQDSFWMAQIAQVSITPERTFELEPEIGDHRITFGDGANVSQKFHRLYLFYQQVLSRIGFEKYSRIDISYAGQVVATKKGSEEKRYDSSQGMNNIRQLIRSAQHLQPDTLRQRSVRPLENNTLTEQNLTNYDLLPAAGDSSAAGVTRAAETAARPAETVPRPGVTPARKPKAIMPNTGIPKKKLKTTKTK